MSTRTAPRPVALPSFLAIQQAFLTLLGGVALFTGILIALVIGFDLYHAGSIYPGVSVAGVNLSG